MKEETTTFIWYVWLETWIDFVHKPAQSPYRTKLDLCWFYSVGSQEQLIKGDATNKGELAESVLQQWDQYPEQKLIKVSLGNVHEVEIAAQD